MDDWNKECNPLKNIKEMQDKPNNLDFSKIKVVADKNHVDRRGEPRKDVLIHPDKLICHPNEEARLKEGLWLFFKNPLFKPEDTAD